MTKISLYERVSVPTLSDKLIGTDVNSANKTVNFTIADVLSLSASTSVTFTELQTLIVNDDLIVGGLYIISDFQTIYDQPDFTALGVAKTIVATKTGVLEPLVVMAVTPNTLSPEAYSTLHPNDTIRYDVSFTQTEVMGVAAKGRITLRIDENNNATSYDHRNVVFKRYLDPVTELFTIVNDNGLNSNTLIPTFGSDCMNNDLSISSTNGGAFLLVNNVFGANCTNNTFGANTYNNTFGAQFEFNTFQAFVSGNTFGINCSNNSISNSFFSNTIGDNFSSNNIYESFELNVIEANFQKNNIYADLSNVDFTGTRAYKNGYVQIIIGFDVEDPMPYPHLIWFDANTMTFDAQSL